MKKILNNIFYSFPVQLVLLHLKKHHILIIFWILLFGVVAGGFLKKLGIPYLLLDPEYMGEVNFLAFFIIGVAFGGYLMTWNMTTYILHSFRFPFLATLQRPFLQFCLNNSLIPFAFLLTYLIAITDFQSQSEFLIGSKITGNLLGLLSGILLMIIITVFYFYFTNKNIFKTLGITREDMEKKRRNMPPARKSDDSREVRDEKWRVDVYLLNLINVRIVRSIEHYEPAMLLSVFRQHHINALLIETLALTTLLVLGLLVDYQIFQIPAGASVLLLFSILVMFTGALNFWLRGWRTTFFIFLLFFISLLMQYDWLKTISHAYGLDYTHPYTEYNLQHLNRLSHDSILQQDKKHMTTILENWKRKAHHNYGERPKMIFINTSGGGLRSAVWTLRVLQKTDSALNNKLFRNTLLITGASGGMIGAAYFRELYLKSIQNNVNPYNEKYIENISGDLLNPVTFSMVVSDLFFPIQRVKIGEKEYTKDRGFIFERQLNKNVHGVFSKKIMHYHQPEADMQIPMMIFTPTIMNDGRRLYISAQPVSYLVRPNQKYPFFSPSEIDGVEFRRFFASKDADSLLFTSALRMNASFPYINPTVSLPSNPLMEVMDAGMRDNYGIETSVRFFHFFRDWISKNTSGVIFVQIRDSEKILKIKEEDQPDILDKWFTPISNFYVNWNEFQDYYQDNLINYATTGMEKKADLIRFELIPTSTEEKASLSWRLTTIEKENIIKAINSPNNERALRKLKELLK